MHMENRKRYLFEAELLVKSYLVEEKLLAAFGKEKPLSFSHAEGLTEVDLRYVTFSRKIASFLNENIKDSGDAQSIVPWKDFEQIRHHLTEYAETVTEFQPAERFYPAPNDSFYLRRIKFVKGLLLKLHWTFITIGNIFRKTRMEKQYRKHQIPEAALAEFVFINRFLERLIPVYASLLQNREARFFQLYQLDHQLENGAFLNDYSEGTWNLVEKVRTGIEHDKEALIIFFDCIDRELEAEFRDLRPKAGTVEFSAARLNRKKLKANRSRILTGFDYFQGQKQLILFAVSEYWRMRLLNRDLIFQLNEQACQQHEQINAQIQGVLTPAFIDFKKELQSFTGTGAYRFPGEEALAIKKMVNERVMQLTELLVQSKISYLLDKPMIELERQLRVIPETHLFASAVFENKPIREKDLRPLRSAWILNSSVFLILQEQFAERQRNFSFVLQQLGNNLNEIRSVVEYTIDYYLEQTDRKSADHELSEGLGRLARKAEDNLAYLTELLDQSTIALGSMSAWFTEKTLVLFEPSRLDQTARLNRRREYLDRKKLVFLKLWNNGIVIPGKTLLWIKHAYVYSNNKYFNLRNLLGISYEKEPISTELSNYLSFTRQAIGRLPVMYQKLFENSPLTDERFFIPREYEMEQLAAAQESWRNGNFAPTCLVGEQGSGATTIFNFFTSSIQGELVEVGHHTIMETKHGEKEFLDFFRLVFPDFEFERLDDLIDQINKTANRKIIILENIHHFFIRKNGAFGNLFRLFRLMSQTNHHIFWVCSCFVYSWKLLDYTLNISGYFAYVVHFELMTDELVREAILKRHKVSGFKLHFLEPEHFIPRRGYHKLTDAEKQQSLTELLFHELWQHAQGNITLAFIFWLRAIVRVSDDTLFIQQKQLRFSFLNSLKTDELTTLHGILVHGGLTLEEHSAVFNSRPEDSRRRLMVLADDGLLELRENKYVINPLLYRPLVSQLKSLNFIY